MSVVKVQTRTEAFVGTTFKIVVVTVFGVALVSCVGSFFHHQAPSSAEAASPPTAAAAEPTVARTPAPISKEPFSPYLRKDEPEMYARWGSRGVAEIDRLRVIAARRTSQNESCDKVDVSDLDDAESEAQGSPVIFTVCTNLFRSTFTKADLRMN